MEPSHVFAAQLIDTLPESEISEIQRRQNDMSLSLHKASASLSALNEFSTAKWTTLSPRFDAHTKLIKELQADLDHVFRKIRTIKARLNLPNQGDDEEDDNRHAEVEAQTDTGVIGDRNEEREPEVAGE